MANVEKHAPGEFCWIELATTDQAAAKKFYGSLFGWNAMDIPIGPDALYTIFQLEGRAAAAGYAMRPQDTGMQAGAPARPHWKLYVAVANADEAVKRTAQLGGKAFAPAFDVGESGRMAMLQDPAGAAFCVWQAKQNPGIGIAGVPGTLCWADLTTPDQERAKSFYSGLFGWELVTGEKDFSGYLHIKNGEQFIGGLPPVPTPMPAHWLAYFLVSNMDATVAQAQAQGAAVRIPAMSLKDVGRFAVIGDPQGAVFAVFTPERK